MCWMRRDAGSPGCPFQTWGQPIFPGVATFVSQWADPRCLLLLPRVLRGSQCYACNLLEWPIPQPTVRVCRSAPIQRRSSDDIESPLQRWRIHGAISGSCNQLHSIVFTKHFLAIAVESGKMCFSCIDRSFMRCRALAGEEDNNSCICHLNTSSF